MFKTVVTGTANNKRYSYVAVFKTKTEALREANKLPASNIWLSFYRADPLALKLYGVFNEPSNAWHITAME